jgi:hypothetical protein
MLRESFVNCVFLGVVLQELVVSRRLPLGFVIRVGQYDDACDTTLGKLGGDVSRDQKTGGSVKFGGEFDGLHAGKISSFASKVNQQAAGLKYDQRLSRVTRNAQLINIQNTLEQTNNTGAPDTGSPIHAKGAASMLPGKWNSMSTKPMDEPGPHGPHPSAYINEKKMPSITIPEMMAFIRRLIEGKPF